MSELLGLADGAQAGGGDPAPTPAPAMKAAAMPSAAGMHTKLVKADFHGSIMTGRSFAADDHNALFSELLDGVVHSAQE
jgi:hypothetical protein